MSSSTTPSTDYYTYRSSYIHEHFFFLSRFQNLKPNEAIYDKAIADLNKQLEVYDKILAKQKYLAGDVSVVAVASSSIVTRSDYANDFVLF